MMFSDTRISNADDMEIRDLRSFLAVVRCGSFTAAADELGYTQSAVSQQVAALERDVGHRLLVRRPVRPTVVGERLAEHAARILLRVDVARSELARLSEDEPTMVVAACPLASPWLLAAALREVRSSSPSSQVVVRSVDPASAVAQVASGIVDLALVDGITGPSEPLGLSDAGLLSSAALTETPVVVALAADHPLHRRRSVDLAVLADAPWIVAPGLAGTGGVLPPWNGQPSQPLQGSQPLQPSQPPRASKPPSVLYEGSDLPTLLALVAAGHGAALLPAAACRRAEGVVAIPLRNPLLVHRTEWVTLRTGSPRLGRLVEALTSRAQLDPVRPTWPGAIA